jgi:hypothetical protein
MPIRHHSHSFLVVAAGGGRPLALYHGQPKADRMALAGRGPTLVFDLGRLGGAEHRRLLEALEALRELPYLAPGAPTAQLVGGQPVQVIPEGGKASPGERAARVIGLLGIAR